MLFLGLLFPIVFGFVISLVISPSIAILERIALAYGLGYGLLTLGMFLLNVLEFQFSPLNTALLLSGILVLSLFYLKLKRWPGPFSLRRLNPFQGKRTIRSPLSVFEIVVVVLLGFFILSHVIIALYWPVLRWDALSAFDLRARIFAETTFIPEAADRLRDNFSFFPDYTGAVFAYPPMTSLVHAWLYLSGWESPKIFYPLLLISLVIIFYFSLRDCTPRYHSLLFTLVLVSVPFFYELSGDAITNFPFAFYFGIGTIYLYRWMSNQKRGFLILSGLLLGLSSWVRRESLIFFLGYLVVLLIYSVSRRRFIAPLLFAGPYLAIEFLWGTYTLNVLQIPSATSIPIIMGALRRWPDLFNPARWKEIGPFLWSRLGNFRVFFFLPVVAILLYVDKIRQHRFLFLLVLSNLLIFAGGSYFFIVIRGWTSFSDSPTRLFMMFLPAICYFVALITGERDLFPKEMRPDASRKTENAL